MSRIDEAQRQLMHEWSSFFGTWQETRLAWKDASAAEFANHFMAQWETDTPHFLALLESLKCEIVAARRELS